MRIKNLLIIITALAIQACTTLPQQTAEQPVTTASKIQQPAVAATNRETATAPADAANQDETRPYSGISTAENSAHQYPDIWQRIRADLSLDRHAGSRQVKAKLAWYRRNQEFLDRTADRAAPYIYYIVEELNKRAMPLDLALLPIIESAYHPFAYSTSRASGIWQFIPGTGKLYGLKQNWWYDGRRDIIAATRAALDYLEKLHKQFNGDWLLALAAYNSGELNVARAISKNAASGKQTDFWSLHLPRETRGYVPSLLAVAELVSSPGHYHINLKPLPNHPYFSQVATGGQIDLALAAELADLSMDEIYTLNPAFNQWATDPDGPHQLLIPLDKTQTFKQRLASIDERDRMGWKQHIIQPGESLNLIAQHYNTSVQALQQINGLRGNLIRVGRSLLIPAAKQPLKHYTLSVASRRYRGLQKTDENQYVYTVKRGDTLWDIGRNYGVSIKSLLTWNNLTTGNFLHPGQKLTISLTQAASYPVALVEQDVAPVNYTVKKGDSLWLISKRFGTTIDKLMRWNKLPKGKLLQPGQILVLYIQEA
jgi:membrane-bound lytic murein transglycosylase D